MTLREIIFSVLGVGIGFALSKLIKIMNLSRYRNDVARTLIDCLKYENELTKKDGATDMVQYTVEHKGKEFATYYYGQIFRMLGTASTEHSDPQTVNVVNALGTFLSEAFKRDIAEYKEQQKNKKKK